MAHQAAFGKLVRGTNGDLSRLLDQWKAGTITLDELGDEYYDALRRGHTDAYVLGAKQAGSRIEPLALQTLAEQHGRQAADAEHEWLKGFLSDLEDGRYTDDEGNLSHGAISARSAMYAQKLRATSNQAFIDGSGDDAEFGWIMSGLEHHCEDCPRMAALSPYTAHELYTTPGAGDTECLSNCKCYLKRNDGVRGFQRPDVAANNYALAA